uniref:Nucleoprotein n=1 Tax=Thottapalayam virus TaxID=1980493 RepID=F6MDD0_9VIRU|nr:nucleoprotein [Thottopalayam virus]
MAQGKMTPEELKKLELEYNQTEKALTESSQKLIQEIDQAGQNPDSIQQQSIKQRSDVVDAYRNKLKELQGMIAAGQAMLAEEAKKKRKPDVPGVEEGDYLTAKSSLRYGNVVDLNPLNLEEPAGQTANWGKIFEYILTLTQVLLLKGLYILTTRGRQTSKDNKGTRIKLKDDSCMEDRNGIKQHKYLYISLPTSQSSIQDDELTPGRFRTMISGLLPNEIKAKKLMSPVMGVIGFQHLAEAWPDAMEKMLSDQCEYMTKDKANPSNSTNRVYFRTRQAQVDALNLPDISALRMFAHQNYKIPADLESEATPWMFAKAPDRCPPTVLQVAGIPELGAFLALMQDIRSGILASGLRGTAEEKIAKKSSFYQSYVRRTQSMGVNCDQKIIHIFMDYLGSYCVDHFNLGDDMDPELKAKAQALLEKKVKEISSQEPIKL